MPFNIFFKTQKPEPLKTEPLETGLIKISGCDNPKRCGDVIFVHGLGGHARGTWHPQELRDDNNFGSSLLLMLNTSVNKLQTPVGQ